MAETALDKPFSKEILQTAKELAMDFHMTIEKHERLGYVGCCKEMPTVMNDGKTEEDCVDHVRDSIRVAIATMLEINMEIPQPKTFPEDGNTSVRKVAGMEIFTSDNENFYIQNQNGSGNIWHTKSVRILKILHENLGEFIEEVEKG